jgi:hypothetical protein
MKIIYTCEFSLEDHSIEYGALYNGTDHDENHVEFDQQFNQVYAESAVSREAAFSLIRDEITRIYNQTYKALRHLEGSA